MLQMNGSYDCDLTWLSTLCVCVCECVCVCVAGTHYKTHILAYFARYTLSLLHLAFIINCPFCMQHGLNRCHRCLDVSNNFAILDDFLAYTFICVILPQWRYPALYPKYRITQWYLYWYHAVTKAMINILSQLKLYTMIYFLCVMM